MQDFVTELEQAIRVKMVSDLTSSLGDSELNAKDLGELLVIYGNWRSRLISSRSRQVHRSSELSANPKSMQYVAALDAIESDIRSGADLNRYLSRGVTHAYVPSSTAPAKAHQRRDRDLLVAEWGVRHLHLSTRLEADGFVERTGDLLFASFRDSDAYFIDIYPHTGSWALEDVVRTAVGNWPQAGLFSELNGAAEQTFTDTERLKLRKAGVTSIVNIDGHSYMPPGQTTAGTPVAATRASMALQMELRKIREDLAGNPAWLDNTAKNAGYVLDSSSQWSPRVNETGEFGFAREEYFVVIGHLP